MAYSIMDCSFPLARAPPLGLLHLREPLDGEGRPIAMLGPGVAQVLSLGAGMGPGPDAPSAADPGRPPAAPDHQVRGSTWDR